MCFDLVDQVLREYLDSEMVGWTGPQFAHNAPRGKPIPSCYEVKRIMAKCIISLNLYVVIFAVYIDPNCNGWNINQIVFQKDSFHKKEIYFLLLYIYLQISCERCATYELLLNLPQYCILSWDTINRHNISTSNILMGAVFFAFSARKGLYLSLFLGKWKETECL